MENRADLIKRDDLFKKREVSVKMKASLTEIMTESFATRFEAEYNSRNGFNISLERFMTQLVTMSQNLKTDNSERRHLLKKEIVTIGQHAHKLDEEYFLRAGELKEKADQYELLTDEESTNVYVHQVPAGMNDNGSNRELGRCTTSAVGRL